MKILAVETSCDETAISIADFESEHEFKILSDIVLSQINLHKKYGGVFPALAKREHTKNLYPIFLKSLKNAKLLKKRKVEKNLKKEEVKKLENILKRDLENLENLKNFFKKYKKPKISALAITYGPGLEMSLWTGFNFIRALSEVWKIRLIPINHMEGHIQISRLQTKNKIEKIEYPLLSLLISGGHTELILSKKEFDYKILGQTLDDAVGEAYDKTARLLKLPYPGGPEISKLAEPGNRSDLLKISLPRPMLKHNNFDFSFSGLKTAVLYLVKNQKRITKKFKEEISTEFENAVTDVLLGKTKKALKKYQPKTLIVGGGVSANKRLRKEFKKLNSENLKVLLPNKKYTGDNALMIALAAYFKIKSNKFPKNIKKVIGNLKLK